MIVQATWHVYVDGASRRNPGLSGAGIYAEKDGKAVIREGFFLGTRTNNEAEYLALLVGLFLLKKQVSDQETVIIRADSELLIKQIGGYYKVREPRLLKFHTSIKQLLEGMHAVYEHIPRERNYRADELANDGIDKRRPLPPAFVSLFNDILQ